MDVIRLARDEYRHELAAVWPQVEQRLLRMLVRRGACRDAARDIAQEVALRVIDNAVAFADVEELLRWCNVTGGRLLVDHHRAQARWAGEPDPERAAPLDTSQLVELRVYVEAVVAGLRTLSASDQAALVGRHRADPGDRTGANRLAARRSRARARLRRLADPA